ncbi:MAG: 2-oxo acid dehydrogenase subunit E2 [Spirochaetales bacterium]|nr:2-oxo acid dehydrogenase subunit E2 [Spirochaetales bacterium]
MASIVIMPKQGLLMEEGVIVNWIVKEGGTVKEGEPLFEMETDKLTITMDSTATGTVLKILHPEGDTVPITKPIAIIGEPGEDISALLAQCGSDAPVPAAAEPAKEQPAQAAHSEAPAAKPADGMQIASPRAKLRAEENGIDLSKVKGTGPDGYIIEKDVLEAKKAAVAATPLARNIAAAQGTDLASVKGSGVNGKITASDLAAPAAASAPARGDRVVPMTGMRKAIARNMTASRDANVQACHFIDVDMTAAMAIRNKYKAADVKISFNDIIIRVCAQALKEFPIVNASVDGNNIVYHDAVNIGNAVAVPNGLIVPVIKDADLIGLKNIAKVSAELVGKARNGALSEADYHGGTFTVTSLGMFDIDKFIAIINPPESAILSVGKIDKKAVVVTAADGTDSIVIRPICTLGLSYNHCIIDGADAAKFLKAVKNYLQNPDMMI